MGPRGRRRAGGGGQGDVCHGADSTRDARRSAWWWCGGGRGGGAEDAALDVLPLVIAACHTAYAVCLFV